MYNYNIYMELNSVFENFVIVDNMPTRLRIKKYYDDRIEKITEIIEDDENFISYSFTDTKNNLTMMLKFPIFKLDTYYFLPPYKIPDNFEPVEDDYLELIDLL